MKIFIVFLTIASVLAKFTPDTPGKVTCTSMIDPVCGQEGSCRPDITSLTNFSCHCDPEWWTPTNQSVVACSEKRPQFLTALLLSIFLGYFGVGSFYIGWNLLGAGVFIIVGSVCGLACCCGLSSNDNEEEKNTGCKCLIALGLVGMYIAQLVLIINGCNKDGIACY